MTLKSIDANIARITTNAAKLNTLIHTTAMMVLNHAAKHGDCTRALTLVMAMPASHRRTTLVAWFAKYSPIRVFTDGRKEPVGMLKKDEKGFTPFNVEKADANPFYVIAEKTPEEAKPLDFEKLLALVQATAKRINTAVDEGRVVEADADSARAIVATLTNLNLKRVKPANDEARIANPREKAAANG